MNISSTAGLTGYFSAAYCASKWGLLGLSRAAALELADKGIRVNSICPGLVETPMALLPNAEHDAEKAKAFLTEIVMQHCFPVALILMKSQLQ